MRRAQTTSRPRSDPPQAQRPNTGVRESCSARKARRADCEWPRRSLQTGVPNRASSLPCHPAEANDGFERTVGLQDREEHLVRTLIPRRPVTQHEAAKIERRPANGGEKLFARRLALDALERLDHEPAGQIAFQ